MEIITPRELYIELFDKKGVNEQIMYVCKVDITTPPKFYRYILDGSITREFIDIFKYDGRVGYIIKRQLNKEKKFWQRFETLFRCDSNVIKKIKEKLIELVKLDSCNREAFVEFIKQSFPKDEHETEFLFKIGLDDISELLLWVIVLTFFPKNAHQIYKSFCLENPVRTGCGQDDDQLPHELTNTEFKCTKEEVLFREDEYDAALEKLEKTNRLWITGMRGRGKTTIARLIYSYIKDDYDCCGWIDYIKSFKNSCVSEFCIKDNNRNKIDCNDIESQWLNIYTKMTNSKKSKLLIIDNVDIIDRIQNPVVDRELLGVSNWTNTTVIVTSRMTNLPGFNNILLVDNLGDEDNYDKCVKLFYYYNTRLKDGQNEDTVKKLCRFAGYNTLVIEILAKGSMNFDGSIEEFYELCRQPFEIPSDSAVLTYHDYTRIKTEDGNNYYTIGEETVASQLYKLFNIRHKKAIEQLILWDFHYLPENFKVSQEELQTIMGFSKRDIFPLVEEGWLKNEGDFYFIHPFVRQAVFCSQEDWNDYWKIKKQYIKNGCLSNNLLVLLERKKYFAENDRVDIMLRKLIFADSLTYNGECIDVDDWIYIADYSRKSGVINTAMQYYKKAYDKLKCAWNDNKCNDDRASMFNYWKSTYYYGYLLSYSKNGCLQAESFIREALDAAEYIYCHGLYNDFNLQLIASSLDHLGYILYASMTNDIHRLTETDYILTEAVELRRVLCEKNSTKFRLLHDYAWSLDNLGAFYSAIKLEDIHFETNAKKDDITYITREDILRMKQDCESLLKEALQIRESLASARSDNSSSEVAWTSFNIAVYLMDENRYEEAEKYIKNAMDIYRVLESEAPGTATNDNARTLVLYSKLLCHMDSEKKTQYDLLEEALNLYNSINDDNDYSKEISEIQGLISKVDINTKNK